MPDKPDYAAREAAAIQVFAMTTFVDPSTTPADREAARQRLMANVGRFAIGDDQLTTAELHVFCWLLAKVDPSSKPLLHYANTANEAAAAYSDVLDLARELRATLSDPPALTCIGCGLACCSCKVPMVATAVVPPVVPAVVYEPYAPGHDEPFVMPGLPIPEDPPEPTTAELIEIDDKPSRGVPFVTGGTLTKGAFAEIADAITGRRR